MNGAGTGMVAYQVTRQIQARRRALSAVNAVVLGTTSPTTRRLPSGSSTSRSTATSPLASALFVPRSNPIWVQKEGAGLASGAAAAGSASGSNRCQRGGSWNNNANNAQVANRNNNNPNNRNNNYGFRLVRNAN